MCHKYRNIEIKKTITKPSDLAVAVEACKKVFKSVNNLKIQEEGYNKEYFNFYKSLFTSGQQQLVIKHTLKVYSFIL